MHQVTLKHHARFPGIKIAAFFFCFKKCSFPPTQLTCYDRQADRPPVTAMSHAFPLGITA